MYGDDAYLPRVAQVERKSKFPSYRVSELNKRLVVHRFQLRSFLLRMRELWYKRPQTFEKKAIMEKKVLVRDPKGLASSVSCNACLRRPTLSSSSLNLIPSSDIRSDDPSGQPLRPNWKFLGPGQFIDADRVGKTHTLASLVAGCRSY